MQRILRKLYGAGILFFYYTKWFIFLGYPMLIYGADYARVWSMDLLWLYALFLIGKDFVRK